MVRQLVDILISQLLAIHLLDTVCKQLAVETDKARFGKFTYQRSDILVLHIGIGIILGTRRSIGSFQIVGHKAHTLQRLAIFGMLLAIEHKRFGHLVVALRHERLLYLVLNILHLDIIVDIKPTENLGHITQIHRLLHRVERLDDGIHNLVE